ncbi:MAG: T9SS type A sorting domain-containing protein [Cytophagaceae bacterium]|jgi:hypothetical protein|nr:T9SS type A sorting domain-containing protein [Cytophagaceae bacterium]
MKKTLLIILSSLVFNVVAQHSQTSNGFSNDCDESSGTGFVFTNYFPSGGGGFDNVKLDTLKWSYGINAGTVGYWIFEFTNTVDLSSPNNIVNFSMNATGRNDGDTSLVGKIALESAANAPLSDTLLLNLSQTYSNFNLSFVPSGTNTFAAVKKIVIYLKNTNPFSAVGSLSITNLFGGSTASINKATFVSSSSVFPNPTSESASISLELKQSANVKVVLNDVLGKEVMVLQESTTAQSINKSFDVAGLEKGVYNVTYLIDGAPAKTELLMVK